MLISKRDGRMIPLVSVDRFNNFSHTKPEYVPFPTSTYPENELGPDVLDPRIFLILHLVDHRAN